MTYLVHYGAPPPPDKRLASTTTTGGHGRHGRPSLLRRTLPLLRPTTRRIGAAQVFAGLLEVAACAGWLIGYGPSPVLVVAAGNALIFLIAGGGLQWT